MLTAQRPKDIVCGRHTLYLSKRTHIMGILNRTPDSFSDGGRFLDEDDALRRIEEMVEEGADIIDIGGESTRPGAIAVDIDEELRRVIPVIKKATSLVDAPISIDTQKSEVAEAALKAGASIVNDISALRGDERMRYVVSKYDVPVVLMHMKGSPRTMQDNPEYRDVISDIISFLYESVGIAKEAGISEDKLIVDPGIGFGKTTEHNLSILKNLDRFKELGRPLLIGVSRKSFIGGVLNLDTDDRLMGTAASVAISVIKGADIVRVHDVGKMREVVRLLDATLHTE
jgi:dihydropteroate synthase